MAIKSAQIFIFCKPAFALWGHHKAKGGSQKIKNLVDFIVIWLFILIYKMEFHKLNTNTIHFQNKLNVNKIDAYKQYVPNTIQAVPHQRAHSFKVVTSDYIDAARTLGGGAENWHVHSLTDVYWKIWQLQDVSHIQNNTVEHPSSEYRSTETSVNRKRSGRKFKFDRWPWLSSIDGWRNHCQCHRWPRSLRRPCWKRTIQWRSFSMPWDGDEVVRTIRSMWCCPIALFKAFTRFSGKKTTLVEFFFVNYRLSEWSVLRTPPVPNCFG